MDKTDAISLFDMQCLPRNTDLLCIKDDIFEPSYLGEKLIYSPDGIVERLRDRFQFIIFASYATGNTEYIDIDRCMYRDLFAVAPYEWFTEESLFLFKLSKNMEDLEIKEHARRYN